VANEKTPRRLGRGLEALLGSTTGLATSDEGALKSIPISQVTRNPFQPRHEFRGEDLVELQESLKASGLLQPITVRRRPGKDGFELIAGERRLRAAKALEWREIPAIIKEIDDRALLTLALIENLQRTDLNPIEEGEGYRQLAQAFALTQQQIAESRTCSDCFSYPRPSEACSSRGSYRWGMRRFCSASRKTPGSSPWQRKLLGRASQCVKPSAAFGQ